MLSLQTESKSKKSWVAQTTSKEVTSAMEEKQLRSIAIRGRPSLLGWRIAQDSKEVASPLRLSCNFAQSFQTLCLQALCTQYLDKPRLQTCKTNDVLSAFFLIFLARPSEVYFRPAKQPTTFELLHVSLCLFLFLLFVFLSLSLSFSRTFWALMAM